MIILPKLQYKYNALEPYIDATTMEIHHTKHHQAYIDNLNKIVDKYPQLASKPLEIILRDLSNLQIPEADKLKLKNHCGGHLNHSFFWKQLDPHNQTDNNLKIEIQNKFGSIDEFKIQFTNTALSHFGSGWAWLVETANKNLEIYSTSNQDSPYLNNHTPLIGLDVWEHAYYLKYQNRRDSYIENWWQILRQI